MSNWSSDVCSSDPLTRAIEDALANRQKLLPKLEARALPRARAEAFRVAPSVFVDNNASNRFTVVEVNAQDRPALLNQLAYALFQSKVTVHSAHVATYGERAVDTFYVTDLIGDKIDGAVRSEEHTSELQSLMRISYAVFCLKKKIKQSKI